MNRQHINQSKVNKLVTHSNNVPPGSLWVMHINIQGFTAKTENLELFIKDNKDMNIGIICINEHWLTDEQEHFLNTVEGFEVADYYARNATIHGGSCILVKRCMAFNVKVRDDLKKFKEDYNFEISAVEIVNLNLLIISIYRVPYVETLHAFLQKFEMLLVQLQKEKKKVIIATDSNIDLMSHFENNFNTEQCQSNYHEKGSVHDFVTIVESSGFSFNIKVPTRVTSSSRTCIDNIITNHSTSISKTKVLELGLSDHRALFAALPDIEIPEQKCQNSMMRVFSDESISSFINNIKDVHWEFNSSQALDDNYNLFLSEFLNCFNLAFPSISRKGPKKFSLKWITNGIMISSRKRRYLYQIAKQTTNTQLVQYYKTYNKIYKKVIKKAKQMAIDAYIGNSKNKAKATWTIIRNELGTDRCNSHEISEIVTPEGIITDKNGIVTEFSNYFANVADNVREVPPSPRTALNKMGATCDNYDKQQESTFKFKLVTPSEVKKIIHSLKSNKSSGWNDVPPFLLKTVSDYIAEPLARIINQSFTTGSFPERIKYSVVKPIHKGGSFGLKDFRPVSVPCSLSIILEKVVHSRLLAYLEHYKKLTNCQHGFRKGFSTTTALTDMINEISKLMDEGYLVSGLICDISKAFDCVSHEILLGKLDHYGVRDKELKWFKSYLSGRKQKVQLSKTDNIESEWKDTNVGVPQGSVLGPLVSYIYQRSSIELTN